MIPRRYSQILFGFILSGLMSCMVSGIATARTLGVDAAFLSHWMGAWLPSWALAFPAVLVVAPVTRRIVEKLTRP